MAETDTLPRRANATDALRIVNFHGIGQPRRTLEPGEERYWISKDRFRAILDRLHAHPASDRIAITFDDGNSSDVEIALPLLSARGLGGHFFVLAGRIGAGGSLGRQDIAALAGAGMRIGNHGLHHRDWTRLSPLDLAHEVSQPKAVLEDILGAPVRSAAIPFGRYNATVIAALRRTGYLEAYSSDGGEARPGSFPMARTSVRSDTSDAELDALLDGRMAPVRRLRRLVGRAAKHWL